MPDKVVTRRMFTRGIPALAGGTALSSLFHNLNAQSSADERANRLLARPGAAGASMSPGLHQLGLREERDALLYIPESSAKQESAPLVVSLHGASRNADRGIELLRTLSDEHGFLLLAPASQGRTWDLIQGVGGPDLAFINHSLARTFESRKIDPARIAMAGFSDGATCSLSLGLANGDLFSAVFGFSPGFVVEMERVGKPPVFISHGTIDPVLPIEQCSRRIVPELKRQGYRVSYREFEGKHTLPPEVASEAVRWFLQGHA
jgi:phospholipase/carboxylesterase